MRPGRRRVVLVFSSATIATSALVAVLACETATSPPDPAAYALTSATGLTGSSEVGTTVAPAPRVQVLDGQRGVSGLAVSWSAEDGSSVAPAQSTTDANGYAATVWTLGPKSGAQHLTASLASGQSLRFTANAGTGPLARLTATPKTATIPDLGDSVSLAATAADRFGNEVSPAGLSWRSLTPGVATVTAAGVVHGLAAGSARIVASTGSLADTAAVEVKRRPTSLTLSTTASTLTSLKATLPVIVTVRDRRGDVIGDAPVQWRSSDTSVAAVDGKGVVTARANGTAIVHATADAAHDSAVITVRQLAVKLAVQPATATVASGDSVLLTAAATDSLGSAVAVGPLTWTSQDERIVKLAGGGWVRGVLVGTTRIEAATGSLAGAASVTVAPGAAASLAISPDGGGIPVGGTVALTLTAADAAGNTVPTTGASWTSSDPSRATVSAGVVTGVSAGDVVIRATLGKATATATFAVAVMPTAAGVRVSQRSVTLNYLRATARLTATVVDAAGNAIPQYKAQWTSLNPAIASVNPDGVVTQLAGSGYATLTAKYGAFSETVNVTVRQVAKVTVSVSSINVNVGDSAQFRIQVADSGGAAIPESTWSIVAPLDMVTMNARIEPYGNGTVWFVPTWPGNTWLKACASPGDVCQQIPVNVTLPPGAHIDIHPSAAALTPAVPSLELNAVLVDGAGKKLPVSIRDYESLDPTVARVSGPGHVDAVSGPGIARIRIFFPPLDPSLTFTVRVAAGLNRIEVAPASVTFPLGGTANVEAYGYSYTGAATMVTRSTSPQLVTSIATRGTGNLLVGISATQVGSFTLTFHTSYDTVDVPVVVTPRVGTGAT